MAFKLGDLLFWIKADKNALSQATLEIKNEFKQLGDDLEGQLWKNTLWGLDKKLTALKNQIKGVEIWTQEFKKLQKEIQNTETRIDAVNWKTSLLTKSFKLLGGVFAAQTFMDIGKSVVTLWANLEQTQVAFTTMLWSADKANQLLTQLSEWSKKTPFELTGSRETAKLLLAMGIQMQDIIPTMTLLGNAASGLWVDLNRIALAYWQVYAKGRLTWQELLQFTEAGVPIIKTLAKELNVTEAQFYKMVEQGKIGSDLVTLAFQKMSAEGGPFFNLMEKQSETLWGVWSNLKDSSAQLWEGIGVSLIPFLKGVVSVLQGLISIVPYVVFWFKSGFTWLLAIVWKFSIDAISYLANFVWFFANIKTNLWILVENFKIAFDNIPGAIVAWLKKAAGLIGDFINFATLWLGWAVADKIWLTNKVNWFIDSAAWKLWVKEAKFKSFELWDVATKLSGAWDQFYNEQIGKIAWYYDELGKWPQGLSGGSVLPFIPAAPWAWSWGNGTSAEEKQIKALEEKAKKEIEAVKNSILSEDEKAKKILEINKKLELDIQKLKWEGYKNDVKLAEEFQKKQKELYDEEYKLEKKRNEERAERTKKAVAAIKDYYKEVTDTEDKAKKKLEDFDEKIKDSTQKIKDWKDELSSEKDNTWLRLAERKLEIEEKLKDLLNENSGLTEANVNTISDTALQGSKDNIFAIWSWATWKDILEAKKLYAELDQINQNKNLISDQNTKDAWRTDTQIILDESVKKQQQIQDKIDEEQVKLDITEKAKAQEQIIYENLDLARRSLESNFSVFLTWETEARIGDLERIRVKAIQTAAALRAANITSWSTPTTTTTAALPWFENGGYTGDGALNEVAWIVHKGEYVINNDTLKQLPEVVTSLERLRQGNTYSKNINVPQVIVQSQVDLETLFDKLKFRL